MPIFEYKCSVCNNKFEYLYKSSTVQEEILCPVCNSKKIKKLFSTFSSNVSSDSHTSSECSSGQCQNPVSGCSTGLCGLN
jgi:putative FmdB family regulatory protein